MSFPVLPGIIMLGEDVQDNVKTTIIYVAVATRTVDDIFEIPTESKQTTTVMPSPAAR